MRSIIEQRAAEASRRFYQAQRRRTFWRKYGASVVLGLVLAGIALASVSGCQAAPPPRRNVSVQAFTAQRCVVCVQHAPALRRLSPYVKVTEVDVDRYPVVAHRNRIRAVPTYIVTSNGQEVARTHRIEDVYLVLGVK